MHQGILQYGARGIIVIVSYIAADYGPTFLQRKGVTDPLRHCGPSFRSGCAPPKNCIIALRQRGTIISPLEKPF